MSNIDEHLNGKLNDGRKESLFKAACEANRQGWTEEEARERLTDKSIKVDGLPKSQAEAKVKEVYRQYRHEHGRGESTEAQARVREDIDGDIIELDLTPAPVPAASGDPKQDYLTYITTVFRPGDHIAIDWQPASDMSRGRYRPDLKRTVALE